MREKKKEKERRRKKLAERTNSTKENLMVLIQTTVININTRKISIRGITVLSRNNTPQPALALGRPHHLRSLPNNSPTSILTYGDKFLAFLYLVACIPKKHDLVLPLF
jgi:hypothetical protein